MGFNTTYINTGTMSKCNIIFHPTKNTRTSCNSYVLVHLSFYICIVHTLLCNTINLSNVHTVKHPCIYQTVDSVMRIHVYTCIHVCGLLTVIVLCIYVVTYTLRNIHV